MEILNTISIIAVVILSSLMIFLKYKEIKNNRPRVKLYITPVYSGDIKILKDITGYSIALLRYKNLRLKDKDGFELDKNTEGAIVFGYVNHLSTIKFLACKKHIEDSISEEINEVVNSAILKIKSAVSLSKNVEIAIINNLDDKICSSSKLESHLLESEVFKKDINRLQYFTEDFKISKISFVYAIDLCKDKLFTKEDIKRFF